MDRFVGIRFGCHGTAVTVGLNKVSGARAENQVCRKAPHDSSGLKIIRGQGVDTHDEVDDL